MIKTKVIKGFDCVKSKQEAQAKINRETKGMTPKQRVQYFHDQTNNGPLGEWWRSLGKRPANAA